jgi:hypothetical protein
LDHLLFLLRHFWLVGAAAATSAEEADLGVELPTPMRVAPLLKMMVGALLMVYYQRFSR